MGRHCSKEVKYSKRERKKEGQKEDLEKQKSTKADCSEMGRKLLPYL